MTAHVLDGKKLASKLECEVKQAVSAHVSAGGKAPSLVVILVGDDPASVRYVAHKVAACERVGIVSTCYRFSANTTEQEIAELIDTLNADDSVDAILLQCPLPDKRSVFPLLSRISREKDVDGLHPYNQGCLAMQYPAIRPCTPWGIMQLLRHHELALTGAHAVIVGASNLVGRPMAWEALLANATVTIIHRFTANVSHLVAQADLLVTAVGQREVIDAAWIKPGAIVVDVAMNTDEAGRLCGDLDAKKAASRAAWLTPVPGGVGPMTVATLLQNTCLCSGVPLNE